MTTLIFILTNFLLFFRLIIYILVKLFLISNILAKILLLFIIILLLYLLNKYPRTRFNVLSKQRAHKMNLIMKYAIKSTWEHIYNMFIISLSFIIFIILMFYLRLLNSGNKIDILEKYNILKEHIMNTSILESILNITIFILLLLLYIIVFSRINKYVKFHYIKRHIYLIGPIEIESSEDDWYIIGVYYEFLYKYTFYHVIFDKMLEYIYHYSYFKFQQKIYPPDFEMLSWETRDSIALSHPVDSWVFSTYLYKEYKWLYNTIWFIITKGHYLFIIMLIVYDIVFNHYQIVLIFKFLPVIFIYDLYHRISKFIHDLDVSFDKDIHTLIYAKSIELWDEKTIIIDGDFYNYERYKKIYKYYISVGFVKNANYTS